jgi:hypothetical protein
MCISQKGGSVMTDQKTDEGRRIDPTIVKQALWAQDRLESMHFGRIDIGFVVHQGRITKVLEGSGEQYELEDSSDDVLNGEWRWPR